MARIVVLRLITGEEILTEVLGESSGYISVKNPVRILVIPSKNQQAEHPSIALAPWLQFASKKEQSIPVHAVVLEYEPITEFINQYKTIHGGIVTPPQKLILPN